MTSMNFPQYLEARPDTRAGRMLATGQVRITVKSHKTGQHITVRFKCTADNRDRAFAQDDNRNWVPCGLSKASHVFIDVPRPDGDWADKVGTYYPQSGCFFADGNADPARIYAAAMAAQWLCGAEFKSEISEEERCGACGRQLTDPESIARGIGPECFGKMTSSSHQVKSRKEQR